MEISVIYEDENIIVIDKPAGVTVTEGPGHPVETTVAGWLRRSIGAALEGVGQEGRWGIVHRLDKDTSGVLIMAKNQPAYEFFKEQFLTRVVTKEYAALCWGDISQTLFRQFSKKSHGTSEQLSEQPSSFVIDAPIDRHPKGISRFIISPEGKPARTHFDIVTNNAYGFFDNKNDKSEPMSLLKAYPKTGRTHQIRVHLKAFGHPIVGDTTYQTERQSVLSQLFIKRQFLHASALELKLLNGDTKRFESELPADLKNVLASVIS